MSFHRLPALESQPTDTRREDDAEYSDDPEFQRFTTQLSERLFGLTRNISQLGDQIRHLGTRRENERVRERIQEIIEETGNEFKEIGEDLKRVRDWHDLGPSQRFIQGRLAQEFNASLRSFQDLQNQAIDKQKAARAALEEQQSSGQASSAAGPQSQQQQQQQQTQEGRLAPQSEVDFQESLIIEREVEIRQIQQSVSELNEIFRDVASMVNDQGTQIDTIGQNIEETARETRGADSELRAAQRHQRSARSKACCLLLVLAIVLVIVILAVVLG